MNAPQESSSLNPTRPGKGLGLKAKTQRAQTQTLLLLSSTLRVERLLLGVHIGCSAAEQAKPQPLAFSLTLKWQQLPKACLTDELADTLCYDQTCSLIGQYCQKNTFQTVERLCQGLFEQLCEFVQAREVHLAQLKLEVHKLEAPVKNLQGGARFEIKARWAGAKEKSLAFRQSQQLH